MRFCMTIRMLGMIKSTERALGLTESDRSWDDSKLARGNDDKKASGETWNTRTGGIGAKNMIGVIRYYHPDELESANRFAKSSSNAYVDNDPDDDKDNSSNTDAFSGNNETTAESTMTPYDETLKELKGMTLQSYRSKSETDIDKRSKEARKGVSSDGKIDKRAKGISTAKDKLRTGKYTKTTWKTDDGKTAHRQSDGSIKYTTESVMTPRSILKTIIKEEYTKLIEETKKTNKKISSGLDTIRKECFVDMMKRTREMGNNFAPALEKRMQINTVAEMLEVPVNDLMLYFMNEVKHSNDRQLVEYRQGHVTFYAN